MEQVLSAERLLKVAGEAGLLRRDILGPVWIEERLAEQHLDVAYAHLGQADAAVFLIDLVVLGLELLDDLRHTSIPLEIALRGPGDDQRRTGFVDQDVIDLVHDGVVVAALHAVAQTHRHVVAQIIETELRVGPVGHVRGVCLDPIHEAEMLLIFMRRLALEVNDVGLLAVFGGGSHLEHADRQAKHLEDGRHPASVTARQIVVHGDEVSAAACQSIQVQRQGSDQRLAFAGLHLGDLAAVQHDAADDLHIVMTQADRPLRRLADSGEGLRQDFLQDILFGLVVSFVICVTHRYRGQTRPELIGLPAQFVIRELLELRFELGDRFDLFA